MTPKRRLTHLAAIIAVHTLGSALIAPVSGAPANYTFDGLSNGNLVGQDGWYADTAQSPVASAGVSTGTGINSTKVMTSGATTHDRAIRNFGAPFYGGMETKAVFQYDFKVGTAWTGAQIALAGNSNPNLVLNGNINSAFSPKILVSTNPAGTGLVFTVIPKLGSGWGTAVTQTVTLAPTTIRVGDWIQVAVIMDLNGTGTGMVRYKNLTLSQTNFTTVLSNVNLGLNASSSPATQWNQVWARVERPSGGAPQYIAIDNLTMVTNGPGSENFEGALATRYLNVYDYTSGSPILRSLAFPNFVPLLANHSSAQSLQFNEGYIPNINNTADFARIVSDPAGGANKCVRLQVYPAPGATGGRNELHYSTPYVTEAQANGTTYTFALRFFTPVVLPGNLILMQGYSEFPWLRIHAHGGQLMLDLAKSSSTDGSTGPDLDGTWGDGENPWLGSYEVGSWNTLVMQVTHSNIEAGNVGTGKIDVFVNGNKMTTYSGRTSYLKATSGVNANVPWLKAGPYGSANTIYYDDVHWKSGIVYPFTEPGIESGGIYEFEPLCALGKRASVNGTGTGDPNNVFIWGDSGGSRQRWTALMQADGSFELMSVFDTAKRLHVPGAGGSGTNVFIYPDNNAVHSRWKCQWQSNGSFELIPQHNLGIRLDVNGGGNSNGANVQVFNDNNSNAQRWRVIRK